MATLLFITDTIFVLKILFLMVGILAGLVPFVCEITYEFSFDFNKCKYYLLFLFLIPISFILPNQDDCYEMIASYYTSSELQPEVRIEYIKTLTVKIKQMHEMNP